MKSVRKGPFAKFIIGIVVAAFCANSSGIAFATNNLKRPAAAKDDSIPNIAEELKRANNKDGGEPLFRLARELDVVRDFTLKVAKRYAMIYATATQEGLSKEVTLMVGTWRPDTDKPALATQIADAIELLNLELALTNAHMLAGGAVTLKVAFELSKETKEISSGELSKVDATRKAHEAIKDWFHKTYKGEVDPLWGNKIRMLTVDPDPYGPANIRNSEGTFLSHGILFASGGLDVKDLIKILHNAATSGLVNTRVLDVFMDFKSYPLKKRNPSSIKEFAKQLYEAEKNGEINSNFFRLTIADTEGNLRDWDLARAEGERGRLIAARDGGKLTVAYVGGAPKPDLDTKLQGIAHGYALRADKTGEFDIRMGSRSAQDAKKNIYKNKDAVVGAQIIKIAVPATVKGQQPLQAWKDTIFNKEQDEEQKKGKEIVQTGIAPYLEKGAIIIVMGNALSKTDQDALAAEGLTSLGELTQAWINKFVPEKGVKVVECFNSAPGEWVTDLDYELALDVITVSDDRAAAQFVIDNYINKFPGLNGVYAGPLANAKYLEYLTKLIIQSKKMLLLGLPLKDLFDNIVERKGDIKVDELMAINQPSFEARINKILSNPQIVLDNIQSLKGTQEYLVSKEIMSILLRGYAELAMEKKIEGVDSKTCALITKTCDECDAAMDAYRKRKRNSVEAADAQVANYMPGNIKDLNKEMKTIEGPLAIMGMDGEQVLKNPGMLTLAKELISKETANVSIVVSANNDDEVRALRTIGVADVAKIEPLGLGEIVKGLKAAKNKNGITVGLVADTEKVKSLDTGDIIVYKLQMPPAQKEGVEYAVPWKQIFADFVDRVYQNDKVTRISDEIKNNYRGKIASSDPVNFKNLLDVPLVAVTEKNIIDQIITYIKTVQSI